MQTPASSNAPIDYEQILADNVAEYYDDPLGFAEFAFPWGEGDLECISMRTFQREGLAELRDHLQNPETRFKVFRKGWSSGHGIGKTAVIGMVCVWGKSTCIDCKVMVIANTGDQLKTKTQPEMAKWFRMAINAHWFDVNVQSIKVADAEHENEWRTDFISWTEDNPQAVAGAHNYKKRLIIIIDEASEVADIIYKTIEGALTDKDTEIIWLIFSQATKSEGYFYEALFGSQRHRWRPEAIDSRTVEGTNLEELEEMRTTYGENSDHFRVRVRGLYPLAGGGQFIEQDLIEQAQKRTPRTLADDPLVAGVDFAWGGSDENVIRFRKGFDAKSIPPVRIKGEFTRDAAVMTGKLASVLTNTYFGDKVAMLFFDSAGIAAPVEKRLRDLGHKNIMVANFGADSPAPECAYMRDYMWNEMKKWLKDGGAIDDPKSDDGKALAADLKKPVLVSDRLQRIKLEPKDLMKKRLKKMGHDGSSPDDGDALALTFAMPVVPKKAPLTSSRPKRHSAWG